MFRGDLDNIARIFNNPSLSRDVVQILIESQPLRNSRSKYSEINPHPLLCDLVIGDGIRKQRDLCRFN